MIHVDHPGRRAFGRAVGVQRPCNAAIRRETLEGNLQTLVEIGVDKNSTVVFPAPLMSTIGELGTFLQRESAAAAEPAPAMPVAVDPATNGAAVPTGS